MAKRWVHPMQFTGTYPTDWAGSAFLQWSSLGYWHEGVDYNYGAGDDDFGMPIYATSDGTIEWIGEMLPGYGHHMFIKHDDEEYGIIYSHYGHLKQSSEKIKVGDTVTAGQQIAQCGNTGWNNMYAHLHFEIRKPTGGGYNFWPDPAQGWDQTKIKQYYFDPFLFVEDKKKKYQQNPCTDIQLALDKVTAENKTLKTQATDLAATINTLKKQNYQLTINTNLLNTQISDLTRALDLEKQKSANGLKSYTSQELLAEIGRRLFGK